MGICNVTPDSFSDGGRYATREAACARVDAMLGEGADIIDIGGESTRPGAKRVPAEEQLARVLDVVKYAAARACVSIDTMDPAVAAACLDAGACIVNDVSCMRDETLAKVVASHDAALVIMHSRGHQEKMAGFSVYDERAYGDVVADVLAELHAAAAKARSLGVAAGAIALDPGLGFEKSARHSFELLRETRRFARGANAPVVVGASRKSFLKMAGAAAEASDRLGASIASAAHAAREGAAVLRVHDVAATREAIDVDCMLRASASSQPHQEEVR